MSEKGPSGVSKKAQPRIFHFAVLDGDKPGEWKPWNDSRKTFATHYQEFEELMAARPVSQEEPRVTFMPILKAFSELKDSERLHGVVGAIIDAGADPGNVKFYSEKMDWLAQLCAKIRASAMPEDRLLKLVNQFEIWFVTCRDDIESWLKWREQAKDIVHRAFEEWPRIEFLTAESFFRYQARRFVVDSRSVIMWGRR